MMLRFFVLFSICFIVVIGCENKGDVKAPEEATSFQQPVGSLYDFTAINSEYEEVKLSHFKGNVLFIVNVASNCGFTSQYEDLQTLHNTYHERGFTILAFPSNDFNQELGTVEEVVDFCTLNYGVTFPIFDLVHVKGEGQHELYKWLTDYSGDVKWNFEKYLISRDGAIVGHYTSRINPLDNRVINQIEKLLNE